MTIYRLGFFLPGSLLVVPMAQAHPGHQNDGGGLLASLFHSFMSMDYVLFLLAVGAGYALWPVTGRVTRKLGAALAGGGLWMRWFN